MLGAGERRALTELHEKLLAGLASDRASARRLCRLCDADACGHERGTCPVTMAVSAPSRPVISSTHGLSAERLAHAATAAAVS